MTMGDRIAVMRDGAIQQVATPRELYDHPRNTYVGDVHRSSAHELFRSPSLTELSEPRAWSWRCHTRLPAGQAVFGITRGGHVTAGGRGAETLRLTVDIVECLGSDQYHVRQGGRG